jgi:hypothetical protein
MALGRRRRAPEADQVKLILPDDISNSRQIDIELLQFGELIGRAVSKALEIQALLDPEDDLWYELQAFIDLDQDR